MRIELESIIKKWIPRWTVYHAYTKVLFSRHKLPPSEPGDLDQLEKADRRYLIQLATRHGPIFKSVAWDDFWVCIIGIPLCTRFLHEHKDALLPVTLDLAHMFPKGFMRQMQGETHVIYRTALNKALREDTPSQLTAKFELLVVDGLATYVKDQHVEIGSTPEAYISALNKVSTGMLLQVFFGAALDTDYYEELTAGYKELGPYGLVWNPGLRQEKAFKSLCLSIRSELSKYPDKLDGVAARVNQQGLLDETMLGNLIYMVEMGRYDTHGLFRWLSKYASEHPVYLQRIAQADTTTEKKRLARSFVLETLRMDQSERLVRRVKRDIIFDGFLIPKYSTVRLCLWESHKSEENFPDPFQFDPERFLADDISKVQFSPFGLDQHHCPMSGSAILMSEIFIRVLACKYKITTIGDGTSVRGAYHWEPAAAFGVRLSAKRDNTNEI
ncbi:MAG: cytochrome P450 [Colwellia sp.]|nr:cytochrome P450 [Colwellia sp.]